MDEQKDPVNTNVPEPDDSPPEQLQQSETPPLEARPEPNSQTQTPAQHTTGPHKNHKAVLMGVFAGLLLIAGAATAILLMSDDEEEPQSTQTSQVSEEPVENVESAPLLTSDYLDSYTIDDTSFGTMVDVEVDNAAGTRTIDRNALPNHSTGDFPNEGNPNEISEQDFSETYPLNPTYTGSATMARTVGIAINGVKFEPDTAERAVCEDGVEHSIEAIQEMTDLGLDFNNAHVKPNGEYHYHGVSDLLVDIYSGDNDLVHVGFAADGHLIYYSKSGAYQPSYELGIGERNGVNCTYTVPGLSGGEVIQFGSIKDGSLKSDWDYDQTVGDLDECNGIEIDGQYVYFITDAYPYVGRCLNGEFSEALFGGGTEPAGQTQNQGSGAPSGAPPVGAGAPPSGPPEL